MSSTESVLTSSVNVSPLDRPRRTRAAHPALLLLLVGCGGAPFTVQDTLTSTTIPDAGSQESSIVAPESAASPDASGYHTTAPGSEAGDVDQWQLDSSAPAPDAADTMRLTTCADVLTSRPGAPDGTYTLYDQADRSRPWQVYCADMATSPKEYLPLPSPESNFSQDFDGVRTSYSRVRLLVDLTEVDVSDQRFAVTTGAVNASGVPKTMAYATAVSGNDAPSGTGMVDLTGTGFAVAPGAFALGGFDAQGSATYSASGQVVTLAGGGYGGWIGPAGLSNPFTASVASGWLKLEWHGK